MRSARTCGACIGEPVGKGHGFAFSEALTGKGGAWDWNSMSAWLANPKKFAPGHQDDLCRARGIPRTAPTSSPSSTRKRRAEAAPAAPAEATAAAATRPRPKPRSAGAQKAENEPVLNEAQAAKGGQKTLGGEAAPKR